MQDYSERLGIACEYITNWYSATYDGNFEIVSVEPNINDIRYTKFFKFNHPHRIDIILSNKDKNIIKIEEIDGALYTMMYAETIDLDLFLKLEEENKDMDEVFWNYVKSILSKFDNLTDDLRLFLALRY